MKNILELANEGHLRMIQQAAPLVDEYMVMDLQDPFALHGKMHAVRTAIIASALWEELQQQCPGDIVWIAALLHDVGRHDDSADPQHGLRSVQFVDEAVLELEQRGIVQISNMQKGGIYEAVIEHCKLGFGPFLHQRLVKDADKLERVRLGGVEHVDIARLSSVEAVGMLERMPEFIRLMEEKGEFYAV